MVHSNETKLILKTSVLTAVFTVCLLLLLNYFFNHTWNLFLINQSKGQPFTVSGTGTVTAKPDQSDISFTVSKTETSLQAAQSEANSSTNTIVSDLLKLGIAKKNIQTTNYNSSPNYTDNSGGGVVQPAFVVLPHNPQSPNQIISYTVSEDVDITIQDSTKVNQAIDTITKAGAENISGPNLTFSDAKQQQMEDQARLQAITNAKQKAQSVANAAGIQLGRIIGISDNEGVNPYPVAPILMRSAAMAPGASAPTQINSGENTVTETITLSYEVL